MSMRRCVDKLAVSLLSILLAVIVGSIVIVVCGFSPLDAYKALVEGAFGSADACMSTFEKVYLLYSVVSRQWWVLKAVCLISVLKAS